MNEHVGILRGHLARERDRLGQYTPGAFMHAETLTAIAAYEAAIAALSAPPVDPWQPSGNDDYDRAIHCNPDAAAWADFFVATFPGQAAHRDLMLGWFANAMMAMHDHLKSAAPPVGGEPGLREAMMVVADRITARADMLASSVDDGAMFRSYAFEVRALANTLAAPAPVDEKERRPCPRCDTCNDLIVIGYCRDCAHTMADAAESPAPVAEEPVGITCETCSGGGTIDETLGGYAFSNPAAECPDCDGVGEIAATPPAARHGEDKIRRVIELAKAQEPWDGKTFNEELSAAIRYLSAPAARPSGEGDAAVAEFRARNSGFYATPAASPVAGDIDDAMVERATMALLGHATDNAPGIDWQCNRQWTVNKVREQMRAALSAAALPAGEGGEDAIEAAAIALWHRFAPDSHIEWGEETHKAEYRDAARAALEAAASPTPPASPPGVDDAMVERAVEAWEVAREMASVGMGMQYVLTAALNVRRPAASEGG